MRLGAAGVGHFGDCDVGKNTIIRDRSGELMLGFALFLSLGLRFEGWVKSRASGLISFTRIKMPE